jgi:hypothetical protein
VLGVNIFGCNLIVWSAILQLFSRKLLFTYYFLYICWAHQSDYTLAHQTQKFEHPWYIATHITLNSTRITQRNTTVWVAIHF